MPAGVGLDKVLPLLQSGKVADLVQAKSLLDGMIKEKVGAIKGAPAAPAAGTFSASPSAQPTPAVPVTAQPSAPAPAPAAATPSPAAPAGAKATPTPSVLSDMAKLVNSLATLQHGYKAPFAEAQPTGGRPTM